MSYDYIKLVEKSVIKENYADKTHDDLRNNKLIDCDKIENFYIDSLFYLHLHFSLYLELLNYNINNSFDIITFSNLFNSLNIKFINTPSISTSGINARYKITSFSITDQGSGYTTAPKIKFASTDGTEEDVGTTILNSGVPAYLTSGITGSASNTFQNGDVITFNTPTGGRAAVGIITVSSGSITRINFSDRGHLYAVFGASSTTTATTAVSNTATTTTVTDASGSSQTRTGTITITFTPVNYVKTASVTNTSKVYTSSGTFSIESAPAGGTNASIEAVTDIKPIGYISGTEYQFNFNIFNAYYNSTDPYTNSNTMTSITKNRKPRIADISAYLTLQPLFSITTDQAYSRTNLSNIVSSDARFLYFKQVLSKIFEQDVKNILGYLAYQVRYYNIIVLNTSIQRMIYKYYLNNNGINMNIPGIFEENQTNYKILTGIQGHINDMKINLDNIENDIKSVNNIFSEKKENYPAKIDKLDKNEIEYKTTQDALNNTAKNYNQYYNNYNKLKIYASSIIVFLVILIIATIVITVLPYFNANSKNTYYILVLILLIILTVLYYNNFSHVNLYEKFVSSLIDRTVTPLSFNILNCSDKNNYNFNTGDVSRNNTNKANNYKFFNELTINITNYNKQYSDINAQMSSAIYTTDNTVYEQNADNYLSSMYIDKKRRIDLFRIKRTSLVNLIEAIKQQILYLFNIIFIICLLTIVLLIALILYVNMPQALNIIIIFVSIAIFLIIIYYIYTVVQPTRMIANKNYWANKNPSQETYNKL